MSPGALFFFLPGFRTPLAKQYQGQGIIDVWMKIGKRCRERHCGDARYRSSVIMGTPDTNRFANQKAFFILLLSEWSSFPAAGARKARALQGDTTPGSSANSSITANVLSYQIQVNLYADYLWKKN